MGPMMIMLYLAFWRSCYTDQSVWLKDDHWASAMTMQYFCCKQNWHAAEILTLLNVTA